MVTRWTSVVVCLLIIRHVTSARPPLKPSRILYVDGEDSLDKVYLDGVEQTGLIGASSYGIFDMIKMPTFEYSVLSVKISRSVGYPRLLAYGVQGLVENSKWRCSDTAAGDWFSVDFDDAAWSEGLTVFVVNDLCNDTKELEVRAQNVSTDGGQIYCRGVFDPAPAPPRQQTEPPATTPPFETNDKRCEAIDPSRRLSCGYPGITATECRRRLCCYDDTVCKAPSCFQMMDESEERCSASSISWCRRLEPAINSDTDDAVHTFCSAGDMFIECLQSIDCRQTDDLFRTYNAALGVAVSLASMCYNQTKTDIFKSQPCTLTEISAQQKFCRSASYVVDLDTSSSDVMCHNFNTMLSCLVEWALSECSEQLADVLKDSYLSTKHLFTDPDCEVTVEVSPPPTAYPRLCDVTSRTLYVDGNQLIDRIYVNGNETCQLPNAAIFGKYDVIGLPSEAAVVGIKVSSARRKSQVSVFSYTPAVENMTWHCATTADDRSWYAGDLDDSEWPQPSVTTTTKDDGSFSTTKHDVVAEAGVIYCRIRFPSAIDSCVVQ